MMQPGYLPDDIALVGGLPGRFSAAPATAIAKSRRRQRRRLYFKFDSPFVYVLVFKP